MANELLRAFLWEVREKGHGTMEKKKLLWLMGRSNDTPSVWQGLLQEYEDIGGNIKILKGMEVGISIILFHGEIGLENVTAWTGR